MNTLGSSPLAWGTCCTPPATLVQPRFIPTGVGNMWTSGTFKFGGAVHPHWRGEHAAIVIDTLARNGSSPLAWGTFMLFLIHSTDGRFIPTGVGNMVFMVFSSLVSPVHPHWRGEHMIAQHKSLLNRGSSPLAWGTYHWPYWVG